MKSHFLKFIKALINASIYYLLIPIIGCSTSENIDPVPPNFISFVKEIDLIDQGATDLELKNDGGFLIISEFEEPQLSSLDSAGNILWTKEYPLDQYQYVEGTHAIQRPNGNILYCGIARIEDTKYVFVYTLDELGNKIWEQFLHSGGTAIQQLQLFNFDDSYRLFFEAHSYVSTNPAYDTMHIVNFMDNGKIIDYRKYPFGSLSYAKSKALEDGSIVIPGNTSYSDDRDFLILKINKSGDIVLNKSFGSGSWDSAMSIDESHDGGFVMAGYRTYANTATVYHVDPSGVADFKTYGDSLYIEKNSIRKTDDGGYMFMNYFLKHDPNESTRIYFSKLNSDLEVEWTNWLDDKYTSDITAHSALPTELVPTLDGGFAFLYHNKGKYILVKTKSFR